MKKRVEAALVLSPEQRKAVRLDKAKPIWEEFKKWLLEKWPKLTPKSKLNNAVEYTMMR